MSVFPSITPARLYLCPPLFPATLYSFVQFEFRREEQYSQYFGNIMVHAKPCGEGLFSAFHYFGKSSFSAI